MRLALALSVAFFVLPACDDTYVVPPAASSLAAPTYQSSAEIEIPSLRESQSSVLVTPDKNIGRPTEVVGILDFHSRAESQDKGFDQLRARAAALGADAVIGAEFEHGENGGLSHLSGMAVRYR